MGSENSINIINYINSLTVLSSEQKQELIKASPKNLEDVSFWLKEKGIKTPEPPPTKNPFSPQPAQPVIPKPAFNIWGNKNLPNFELMLNTTDWGKDALFNDYNLGLELERCSYSDSGDVSQVSSPAPVTDKTTAETKKSSTKTNSSSSEKSYEESKENTISALQNNVKTAIDALAEQRDSQGNVSKIYNSWKEFRESDMSESAVKRVILAEQKGVEMMDKANKGELTQKEYYENKIQLAIDLLPNSKNISDKEKEFLKERLKKFTIEELNSFIDEIKNCDDKGYEKLDGKVQQLIKEGEKPNTISEGKEIKLKTINSFTDGPDGNKKMTFEEVFMLERGVEYKAENMEEYKNKSANLALVTNVSQKTQRMHDLLDSNISLVKGNNEGAVDEATQKASNQRLETSLITALSELYGGDEQKIDAELKKLYGNDTISYKDGKIDYGNFGSGMKSYALVDMSKKLLNNLDEKTKKILDGKTLEDYQSDWTQSYKKAYGEKNAKQLASAYSNDQEEGVQKAKMLVSIGGTVIMVGGLAICPPMAFVGGIIGTAGGTAVEAYNEYSKKGEVSDEKKRELLEELATNAALFAVGYGAGSMGNAARSALLAKQCPKLIAMATDIGLDSTISLLGDLALTGQIDLTSEGISQLIAQLSGVVAAKKLGKGVKNPNETNTKSQTEAPHQDVANNKIKYENWLDRKDLSKTKLNKLADLPPEKFKEKLNELYPNPSDLFDDKELMESLGRSFSPILLTRLKGEINADNIDIIMGLLQNQKINTNNLSSAIKCIDNDPQKAFKLHAFYEDVDAFPAFMSGVQQMMAKNPEKMDEIIDTVKELSNYKKNIHRLNALSGQDGLILQHMLNNPDQKTDTFKLMLNRKLVCAENGGGEIVNQYKDVIELAKTNPKHRDLIIDMAATTNRSYQQIEAIINSLNEADGQLVLTLAKKNPNLNIGPDAYGNDHQDFRTILMLRRQEPELAQDIVNLAMNKRMKIENITELTKLIKTHPEMKTDIMRLSNEKLLDYESLVKTLEDFKKYPEMREIMFSPDKVEPDFIEKNPPTQEVLSQRKNVVKEISNSANSNDLKLLQKALGEKFYNIKWEQIIPPNASKEEINKIVSDLLGRTSLFARVESLEKKFGKNGKWASEMDEITDKAALRIANGESFDEVLDNIAKDNYNYTQANNRSNETGNNNANDNVGQKRNTPGINEHEFQTGYDQEDYGEYGEKFEKVKNKVPPRKSPYPDMELTNVLAFDKTQGMMHHPAASKCYDAGMKHINTRYNELQPLIQKVQSGGKLTSSELKAVKAKIAEIHYLFANIMPYRRGSAGIADMMTRALCQSLDIKLPPLKKGIALDLEAFHLNLDEYINKWDSFFES